MADTTPADWERAADEVAARTVGYLDCQLDLLPGPVAADERALRTLRAEIDAMLDAYAEEADAAVTIATTPAGGDA